MTLRLAMWSGPRNISTAMMRSFEHRPDCSVVDEPFYACYLAATGADHPMREEVINSQSTDWSRVAMELSTGLCEAELVYQKHMTHHMLHSVDLDWTHHLHHCFLVRDPISVVSSYVQKREAVTADDIGIIRQLELYQEISQLTGQSIPVIDARQTLERPRHVLAALCETLGISFYEEMLSWPPGTRKSDGVWASHWYSAVQSSQGFRPFTEKPVRLNPQQSLVVEQSRAAYESLLSKNLIS